MKRKREVCSVQSALLRLTHIKMSELVNIGSVTILHSSNIHNFSPAVTIQLTKRKYASILWLFYRIVCRFGTSRRLFFFSLPLHHLSLAYAVSFSSRIASFYLHPSLSSFVIPSPFAHLFSFVSRYLHSAFSVPSLLE